jgi:prepilin-type N-terminal cleavage/methylation domain-containing protein
MSRRTGFTLVEVLVVVAIIAVLIGILAPGLARARGVAREARCLSNQKQIGTGWASFFTNHRYFPGNPRESTGAGIQMFDWAGVDFIVGDPDPRFSPNRPLNPYIGSSLNEQARAEVFQCPDDSGWLVAGERYRFQLADAQRTELSVLSGAEDASETVFGIVGCSYRANEWMWAKIGDPNGFTSRSQVGQVLNNRPDMVDNPSRFVLVGDSGPFLAGRYAREQRVGPPLPPAYQGVLPRSGIVYGWWHGYENCQLTFLDGSVRKLLMTPGTAATNEYSFWLVPRLHDEESSVYAHAHARTGRPPRIRTP